MVVNCSLNCLGLSGGGSAKSCTRCEESALGIPAGDDLLLALESEGGPTSRGKGEEPCGHRGQVEPGCGEHSQEMAVSDEHAVSALSEQWLAAADHATNAALHVDQLLAGRRARRDGCIPHAPIRVV